MNSVRHRARSYGTFTKANGSARVGSNVSHIQPNNRNRKRNHLSLSVTSLNSDDVVRTSAEIKKLRTVFVFILSLSILNRWLREFGVPRRFYLLPCLPPSLRDVPWNLTNCVGGARRVGKFARLHQHGFSGGNPERIPFQRGWQLISRGRNDRQIPPIFSRLCKRSSREQLPPSFYFRGCRSWLNTFFDAHSFHSRSVNYSSTRDSAPRLGRRWSIWRNVYPVAVQI